MVGKMCRFCSKSTGSIPEFKEKLPNLEAKFWVGGPAGNPEAGGPLGPFVG